MAFRVMLGVTGSVAAVKTPDLYQALCDAGCEVKIVATSPALSFFDPSPWRSTTPSELDSGTLFLDSDEWPQERLFRIGEPVLHIELRKWADLLLIAPLDANTLAKVALGLCDNLLTCVYRAWDLTRPVVLAPAMNTMMWEHPATARHFRQLGEDYGGSFNLAQRSSSMSQIDTALTAIQESCPNLRVVGPVSKRLACGDEGVGGMAPVAEIVSETLSLLKKSSNL